MPKVFVCNFLNALKKNKLSGALLVSALVFSCSYKNSSKYDRLPENVKVVYIPMFENLSREPLIETYFTEAIKEEFLRSGYASIAAKEFNAEAILKGKITSVEVNSDESVIESKSTTYLPQGSVLPTQTTVTVKVALSLIKKESGKILWQGEFAQSKNYTPPQITVPVVNSANSLYNLSEKRQTLESLSRDLMQLAYDRMIDGF